MVVALRKLLGSEELPMNLEARSKNIFLVGKQAQRILNTYNKWKGTNYTLVDFKSYEKISPKKSAVILKNGKEISITGREVRKIRNTRLLTFMNFGSQDLSKQVCPASGLSFEFELDIFSTKAPTDKTSTFDLHHMAVSVDGKSEIKEGVQPSRIILEIDLFDQQNIDQLTEFFGMIMLSPSGHKSIHSNYSNESHSIDDYKVSKRPYAIRSEKNYLRFFKEFGLKPKYSFQELAEKLGFSISKMKKRSKSKLSPEEQETKRFITSVFSAFNNIENYRRPLKEVYEEVVDKLVEKGLGDHKRMKLKSFGSFRAKRAKFLGWN